MPLIPLIPLTFRLAVADDVPACLILRGQTRENAISVEGLASLGITAESWSEDVKSGSLPGYVCTEDDVIVGYCFGDKASHGGLMGKKRRESPLPGGEPGTP